MSGCLAGIDTPFIKSGAAKARMPIWHMEMYSVLSVASTPVPPGRRLIAKRHTYLRVPQTSYPLETSNAISLATSAEPGGAEWAMEGDSQNKTSRIPVVVISMMTLQCDMA